MNTTLLKRFAIDARKILIQGVANRLEGLGFDLDTGKSSETPTLLGGGAVFMGNVVSTSFYNRWMSLQHNIERRGVRDVVEEAAYTWFNRLVAIRILSKQHFISPVLQYESDDARIPLIVSDARHGRMPDMPDRTRTELENLLNDDSKTNEQFALLIVAFCHSNPIINRCFGAISDYTELLLPQDILHVDGFVDMLNNTPFIADEDYGSASLIGWLYQFYISDRKDEVFAKKGKYDADEIAPATQIFTPEWIVEYMVQNTIGRIYLDNSPDAADDFKPKWKYLVDQEQRDGEHICHIDSLEDIRCADLGCGSGHIVGYMFEVLFDLYLYEGYSRRDAVEHILKENLTGVDIDTRAKQLATFALLLKACQKDKSFANATVMPNILDMPNPFTDDKDNEDNIIRNQFSNFILGSESTVLNEIVDAVKLMDNAKTLGSIMKFNISERTRNILKVRLEDYEQQEVIPESIQHMIPYVKVILALTENYTALVMNPPYMGSSRFNDTLSAYVQDYYFEGKNDLYSVFILKSLDVCTKNGFIGLVTMESWMFLSSFEHFRNYIIYNKQIRSLSHFDWNIMHIAFGTVAFTIENCEPSNYKGVYSYLSRKDMDFENDIPIIFPQRNNGRYNFTGQDIFLAIPGHPIAYWVHQNIIDDFKNPKIEEFGQPRSGIMSGNSPVFVKLFFEVSSNNIGFGLKDYNDLLVSEKKWFPVVVGGIARKWYGNLDSIIDLYHNGDDIKKSGKNYRLRDPKYYFKESITWPKISSNTTTFRYCPQGVLFGDSGLNLFLEKSRIITILGLLNSKVSDALLKIINPSVNTQVSDIGRIPVAETENVEKSLISQNIFISKLDWDSHETSWDFSENPLVSIIKAAEKGEQAVSEHDTNSVTMRHEQCQGLTQTVSQRDTDSITARHNDYQSVVAPLQQPCNNVTKPLYDDYNAAVISLQSFCNPANGITNHGSTLALVVKAFEKLWTARFMQLHANEEELNRQFIDIYGLQDELSPDVPLDEITILQQGEITIKDSKIVWNEDTLIKQLISYAVGVCMGRYRLDKPGLHIAYPNPSDDDLQPYQYNGKEITIDDDGIIPLMPRSCPFTDNMLKRLYDFIETVFGADNFNDNLNYMEKALGMTLEQYLIKDFWKDHKRMYQNRPIYWLFSSKKGAFQCIAYMHRMDAWTAERVRTKYLLPYIEYLVGKQNDMQANAANLTAVERRELDKITKQIAECREYHDRLHDVADKEIAFDLDDGVVVNYAKFGDVLAKIK